MKPRLDLASVRRHVHKTQTQVGVAMGTEQSAISRIERLGDIRVSTLKAYVEANGGTLRVMASFDGDEIEIPWL